MDGGAQVAVAHASKNRPRRRISLGNGERLQDGGAAARLLDTRRLENISGAGETDPYWSSGSPSPPGDLGG